MNLLYNFKTQNYFNKDECPKELQLFQDDFINNLFTRLDSVMKEKHCKLSLSVNFEIINLLNNRNCILKKEINKTQDNIENGSKNKIKYEDNKEEEKNNFNLNNPKKSKSSNSIKFSVNKNISEHYISPAKKQRSGLISIDTTKNNSYTIATRLNKIKSNNEKINLKDHSTINNHSDIDMDTENYSSIKELKENQENKHLNFIHLNTKNGFQNKPSTPSNNQQSLNPYALPNDINKNKPNIEKYNQKEEIIISSIPEEEEIEFDFKIKSEFLFKSLRLLYSKIRKRHKHEEINEYFMKIFHIFKNNDFYNINIAQLNKKSSKIVKNYVSIDTENFSGLLNNTNNVNSNLKKNNPHEITYNTRNIEDKNLPTNNSLIPQYYYKISEDTNKNHSDAYNINNDLTSKPKESSNDNKNSNNLEKDYEVKPLIWIIIGKNLLFFTQEQDGSLNFQKIFLMNSIFIKKISINNEWITKNIKNQKKYNLLDRLKKWEFYGTKENIEKDETLNTLQIIGPNLNELFFFNDQSEQNMFLNLYENFSKNKIFEEYYSYDKLLTKINYSNFFLGENKINKNTVIIEVIYKDQLNDQAQIDKIKLFKQFFKFKNFENFEILPKIEYIEDEKNFYLIYYKKFDIAIIKEIKYQLENSTESFDNKYKHLQNIQSNNYCSCNNKTTVINCNNKAYHATSQAPCPKSLQIYVHRIIINLKKIYNSDELLEIFDRINFVYRYIGNN